MGLFAPRCAAAAITLALTGFAVGCSQQKSAAANDSSTVHAATSGVATSLPREWIDAQTGHRVIRLSDEDNSESAYFHYHWYSADGRKICYTTPTGISSTDLKTRKVEHLVHGRIIETGRVTNEVFYTHEPPVRDSDMRMAFMRADDPSTRDTVIAGSAPVDHAIYAMDLDTHVERKVVDLPIGRRVTCMNADQTLFAGTIIGPVAIDPSGQVKPAATPFQPVDQRQRMFPGRTNLTPAEETAAAKENGLQRRLINPRPMALFTINIATGEMKTFGYAYAYLNHLQFCPTDPTLLMFCHEGTWHEVDRIWTIRTDGSGLKLMHTRGMDMEIAGHEFWGHDGKTIWFDLQTPRSQVFWIGGINLASGLEVRRQVDRSAWGVHYNVSPDGTMFSSDGGDPAQVAFAADGQWINLFRQNPDGTVKREKLLNMSKHNYDLEPNAIFTPDGKWLTFRSNMLGPEHVFEIEIAKARS